MSVREFGDQNKNIDLQKRNARSLGLVSLLVVCMLGLAFASAPLYDLFCRVTGYGGTTQTTDQESTTIIRGIFNFNFRRN